MFRYTLQEKLALMMTSAGSMRNLASLVGVSHQRIGRWLREGEEGGVRVIPEDAAPLIDAAFAIHTDIVRAQRKVDDIPNIPTPIFEYKKSRNDGRPSDRVFATDARFIRSKLRQKIIKQATDSEKYFTATISSDISADSYFENKARQIIDAGRRGVSVKQLAKILKREFEARENVRFAKGARLNIWTPREPIGKIRQLDGSLKQIPGDYAASMIEEKLKQKHEPNAGGAFGKLADTYVFQLAPQSTAAENAAYAPKRRKKRPRNIEGKFGK